MPLSISNTVGPGNFMNNQSMSKPSSQQNTNGLARRNYGSVNPLFNFSNGGQNLSKNIGSVGSFINDAFNPKTGGLIGAINNRLIPTANAQTSTVQSQASTPLKKTTTTDSLGNTTTHEYHAPAQPKAQSSYQGGQNVPTIGTPEYNQAVQMNRPQSNQTQQQTQNNSSNQPISGGVPGLFQMATGNLLNIGQNGSPSVNQAIERARKFQTDYGQTQADVAGDPNLSLDTKTGIGQIFANRYTVQNAANQQAIQNAQTQQGQQITASQNAASLAAPQSYNPTNIPFNPITGQFGNIAGSSVAGGLAGVGALQQQQQQGADVQTMNSALAQTSGLIDNLTKSLPQGFNANPIALGNALQQWLNTGLVPDPQYVNTINTLQEIANTIAPVLGSPGNPTDLKQTIATQLVPRLLQGQDIVTVLKNLEANALTKIQAATRTATGTPLAPAAASQVSTGSGSGSGGLYDF